MSPERWLVVCTRARPSVRICRVPTYLLIRQSADGSVSETTYQGHELFIGAKIGNWVVFSGPDDVEGDDLPVVMMREDDWWQFSMLP